MSLVGDRKGGSVRWGFAGVVSLSNGASDPDGEPFWAEMPDLR